MFTNSDLSTQIGFDRCRRGRMIAVKIVNGRIEIEIATAIGGVARTLKGAKCPVIGAAGLWRLIAKGCIEISPIVLPGRIGLPTLHARLRPLPANSLACDWIILAIVHALNDRPSRAVPPWRCRRVR